MTWRVSPASAAEPRRTPSNPNSILKTIKRAGSGPIRLEKPTVDTPEQLALLVLNQRRSRKVDDDGTITESDVSTNEPLDVWLRLQGVKKGKLSLVFDQHFEYRDCLAQSQRLIVIHS